MVVRSVFDVRPGNKRRMLEMKHAHLSYSFFFDCCQDQQRYLHQNLLALQEFLDNSKEEEPPPPPPPPRRAPRAAENLLQFKLELASGKLYVAKLTSLETHSSGPKCVSSEAARGLRKICHSVINVQLN